MRLIEYHQIPAGFRQNIHNILTADKINTGHNAVTILEYRRFRREDAAINQFKGDVEFDTHFILLPLLGQATWCNDQYALNNMAHQQLF